MRRRSEPRAVLDLVAAQANVTRERAAEIVGVIRHCVDAELALDHTIAAWPLYLGYNDDPVARAFADRFADASESQLYAVDTGNNEEVAAWLDIPLDVYDRYPLVGHVSLLIKVFDRLSLNERTAPRAAEEVTKVLDAWLSTYRQGRPYRMSHLGLERDLEDWLVDHLEVLSDFGYPVALERRQLILKDRRRPDLVCRFIRNSQEASAGDLLVMELKAGGGYVEAAEQLSGYVAAIQETIARGQERVLGLLITDGASPKTRRRITELGLYHLSAAVLGYRDELADADAPREPGPSRTPHD